MYKGIKKALGRTQSKTAPVMSTSGEVITDKGKQLDRWVEHYSELYSSDNTVATSALDAIEPMTITEELDTEPAIAEISKAIDTSASSKACQSWREGPVPLDTRDARIVTLEQG